MLPAAVADAQAAARPLLTPEAGEPPLAGAAPPSKLAGAAPPSKLAVSSSSSQSSRLLVSSASDDHRSRSSDWRPLHEEKRRTSFKEAKYNSRHRSLHRQGSAIAGQAHIQGAAINIFTQTDVQSGFG